MFYQKLTVITLFSLMIIFNTTPAIAGNLDKPLKDRLENRLNVKGLKNEIASKTGLLKLFRNGHMAIGSGELTAISGSTLTIKKDDKSYTVLTDDKTQFRRKFWGKSNLSEFTVGDKLNVIGIREDEAKTTIKARFIRDISIQMRHGVFFGKVTAITDTSFTMDTIRRGIQTVTVSTSTQCTNRRENTITFSDLQIGHRVRVRGLWNSLNSTITEVTKIKDFSLPLNSSPVPVASP